MLSMCADNREIAYWSWIVALCPLFSFIDSLIQPSHIELNEKEEEQSRNEQNGGVRGGRWDT